MAARRAGGVASSLSSSCKGCAVANVEEAARRLLKALNEHQAHDREGATVQPGDREARDARLRPGSPLYRAAVWWLLDTRRPTSGSETLLEPNTVASRSR